MIGRLLVLPLLLAGLLAQPIAAQGNLSGQGFGYPPGQLSARGLATGGAIAEIDPQSAINPATPMLWGAAVLFGQYDPEFRRMSTPAGSDRTMTARFPGAGVSFRLGRRVAAGANVSTYLDRTWATQFEGTQVIGDDTVNVVHRHTSDGAINDVRLALAYGLTPQISIGIGGHAFAGENRMSVQQLFPDTVRFSDLIEDSRISYSGLAVSAGTEVRIGRFWQIAASGRQGGRITAERGDTTVSSGRIPARFGAGLTYAGMAGVILSARAGWEGWSSLRELGTPGLAVFDGWDYGVGADVTGPRVGQRVIVLRGGVRQRTLPFGAAGSQVSERSFSTGLGIPLAADRATMDIGFARASRTTDRPPSGTFGPGLQGDVREVGYILSFGLRVRP